MAALGRSKLPRRLFFTVAYMYCLLMLHKVIDVSTNEKQRRQVVAEGLERRSLEVTRGCAREGEGLPRTQAQRQAQEAAAVSTQLAQHYRLVHLRNMLADLLYMPQYNLTWCIMPKAASSSLGVAFLELRGHKADPHHPQPPQVILRSLFKSVTPDRVNTTIRPSLKFLVVRHPLQRIVSAFRNKLEDSTKNRDGLYFYKTYGRRIVEKFRKAGSQMKGEGFHKEPTFPEFVDYLLATDVTEYDEHWRPAWLMCHVCDIQYDYILKYENFEDEISYLLEVLKERKHVGEKMEIAWENRGGTDDAVTRSYLGQVGEHKLWQLYDKYRQDFILFDYTMEAYSS